MPIKMTKSLTLTLKLKPKQKLKPIQNIII